MNIAGGTNLGPYEVIAPLGAGGMGEVYRARDTRLRRDVALKVLPADVSSDVTRRARFEQEAHAAAALNHPNILGVHDIGSDKGVFYIATELVDGETLAATIGRGPLPIRALLDIAVQIADGMASAHAAHIVHRDLKPANVMIANDGRVKILDFGLAKQTARAATGDETIMVEHTEPGMIVGTVSYMSPEQARGKPADYRSDQFAFGLVLYEMATARKAFDRAESVQTMAAIISEEPPPIESRLPAPLRWVIDRCLAKDPANRYESSRDLFRELRSLRDHLSEVSTQTERAASTVSPQSTRARVAVPIAIGIAVWAAATLVTTMLRSGSALPDQSAYRFTPFSFEPGGQGWPVFSPDGKIVAFAARQDASEPFQVFIRYLDAPTSVQMTRLPESAVPIGWSPDSKRVVLMTGGDQPALMSIATVGGEPEPFMKLPNDLSSRFVGSVTISPDNKTVAALARPPNDVMQVTISSPPGSPPKPYSPAPFASKNLFNMPRMRFAPDGKHILLIVNAGRQSEEAWLLRYPPEGDGSARPVFPNLTSYGGTPSFAWMPDSRHVVLALQPSPDAAVQLWLADTATGRRHALTSGNRDTDSPAVSPDGERIVLSEGTGHFDVISLDIATREARALIATERNELMPSWAVTEQAMAYVSNRNGQNEIWLHRAGNPDRPIVSARDFPAGTTQWFAAPAISPRADRVAYVRVETGTIARLWISSTGGGSPIQLTSDTVQETPGSWSPDGAWFVYLVLRDGKFNLMKVKTSGQASPVVLKENLARGSVPTWSPAGDWIAVDDIVISPDGKDTRSIGKRSGAHYVFSQDGKLLYGLREEKNRLILFSVDIVTAAERTLGDVIGDFPPGSNLSPSIRLSLAPDGKSFVYGSGRFKSNLWMLEGFAPRRQGFFGR